MLSRVDNEEAEEELKWSDDDDEEDQEEDTPELVSTSEESKDLTEGDNVITEQPVETEGTVTPGDKVGKNSSF